VAHHVANPAFIIGDQLTEIIARRAFDRRLYMVAAILFSTIVLIGFGRTYYLKIVFDPTPLPSLLVHVHGLLMSAWVLLFMIQVRLIAARQVRIHQRLGWVTVGLAVLILVVGVATALRAAKVGSRATPPGIAPLAFLAVPLFDLLMFAIFLGGAIYYRKKAAQHKRLMLLTAINFVPPAIARIPLAPLQALGPLWFFGLPTVLALYCVGLDARRHGSLNRVFLAGTLLLIASYVVRLAIMNTHAWMTTAQWLTGFV
jgi:hypothetical protein